MTDTSSLPNLLAALKERAKELECLYQAEDILGRRSVPIEETMLALVRVIPPGWQFPEVCHARIVLADEVYSSPGYRVGAASMTSPIVVDGRTVGEVGVTYTEERVPSDEGPFLKEERRLLNTIAERIALHVAHRADERLANHTDAPALPAAERQEWRVILDFLRRTDQSLLLRMTRKMINYLCWHGVPEAADLLREFVPPAGASADGPSADNRPSVREPMVDTAALVGRTFDVAAAHLSEAEIIRRIQQWINEDNSADLSGVLERTDSSLAEITEELGKFRRTGVDETELPESVQKQLRVALLRRFFSERIDFIQSGRDYVRVADFADLVQRIVAPPKSRGKLGGKSSGLFVAMQIVRNSPERAELLGGIRMPKTWYVSSDAQLEFIRYNNLEDLYDRKYQEIDQVRQDYPHVVQLFKNSHFPPEIVRGLSAALDDFEDRPLIVRSSSLLEDSSRAAFSGKYKSLFLANRGRKRARLEALQDAIAEVYASVFSPDPIQYRAERGLLDVHEEMGIMIQEVVGRRVGGHFMPSFSGVAFSNNDFRWSPRIRRSDGLVRLVPGLGTRAVDRVSDDYPVLISPGQPGLRVNTTPDEIVRYSPAKIDVIDLEKSGFATASFGDVLRNSGKDYPAVRRLVSRYEDGRLIRPLGLGASFTEGTWVVTFDGLMAETPFVQQMRALLELLQEKLHTPVDIEFASDGEHLYLLQCRPQGYSPAESPAPIPRNLPRGDVLFTAGRYVANGSALNLTHIVYVDPEAYALVSNHETLLRVGRAVGRLNDTLPKRQFVLLGPGRWGSRGDIRLGVNVTYSDISNTAVLAEIARRKAGYLPDLSFGTHFFQDLVESGIRYLPLYPDEPDNTFDVLFLTRAHNILPELLPEFADLSEVVRVIDVPEATGGKVLSILMNGELDEAVGVFAERVEPSGAPRREQQRVRDAGSEEHWRWREFMAERIAAELDRDRFGVRQIYVFGSTKNGTAGPGSDIDLLVHFHGADAQRRDLDTWLDGWSKSLAEINFLRTGYRAHGLLDVHVVTDDEVARRTGFAAKIGAVTDAARPLLPERDSKE